MCRSRANIHGTLFRGDSSAELIDMDDNFPTLISTGVAILHKQLLTVNPNLKKNNNKEKRKLDWLLSSRWSAQEEAMGR